MLLVLWFAHRAGHLEIDARLRRSVIRFAGAGLLMAALLWLCRWPVSQWFATWPLREEATLAVLAAGAGALYVGIILALFGKSWLAAFRGRAGRSSSAPHL